jgi:hypothetical protein
LNWRCLVFRSWRFDDQSGSGEAVVDQVWAELDLLQLALDDTGEVAEVGCREVGQRPLDQGPDAFSRFATVRGEMDSRV